MDTEYTRSRSYIKPDVLENFLNWLSKQNGYTVEYKMIGNWKFAYVNDLRCANFGPIWTFDQRTKPFKTLPDTARLSRDLYKEYDQWRKNFYSA